jgi:hypothetical protein
MTGIYRGVGTTGTGISVEDYLLTKVEKSGDTMTGALSVPAGAAGTQVPQRQEIDTALTLKANIASPTFTGTVGGITGAMVVNTPAGGIAATTVQTALNELDTEKANLVSPTFTGTVGGITGAMIANTPAGGIAATTVQAALNELDTDKAATDQTMYIGTTQVAINRASAALVLTGITSIDGNAATATTISGTASNKLPDIDVTQATGALTVACNAAIYQDFRSATATDGTPTTLLADPADLVIPDGATLGSTTTVAADIAVLMINNAGTAELAVVNLSGGVNLDESSVISTTAIGTGSDSAGVVYSTTARTNVAYKVVKRFTAINTAGSWGDPSAVADINSATLSSPGYGQLWRDVAASRALATTYYNSSSKLIKIMGYVTNAGSLVIIPTVKGLQLDGMDASPANRNHFYAEIPPRQSYSLEYTGTPGAIVFWSELS